MLKLFCLTLSVVRMQQGHRNFSGQAPPLWLFGSRFSALASDSPAIGLGTNGQMEKGGGRHGGMAWLAWVGR